MEISHFRISLKTQDSLLLPPYKGSVFRGSFGNAFKRIACPFKHKSCSICLLKSTCVYSYIFETPLPEESKIMRKYPYVPHPFVIEPPEDRRQEIPPKEEIEFGLLLIGKGIDYLPYFIYTFEEMARRGLGRKRGKLKLIKIKQRRRVIYDGEKKILKSKIEKEKIDLKPLRRDIKSIRVKFLTPTRIIYQGKPAGEFPFHILIRSLLRRISLLAYFHSQEDLKIDFKGLIDRAKKVDIEEQNLRLYPFKRYSRRQDKEIPMEGLIGEIIYRGRLSPFLPYLRAGEILHIGKGTVIGMGRYKILTKG